MVKTITINENQSLSWRWTLYLSLCLTILFFTLFYQFENVVIANYARLAAFISFATAVFASLKLMEGRRTIAIEADEKKLIIILKKKEAIIKENQYPISEIESITPVPALVTLPFSEVTVPLPSSFTYKITLNTSDKSFYLFHFGGAVLSVHKKQQEALDTFFKQIDLFPSNSTPGESDEKK